MRILYVINGFDPGGAEHGLLTLVENGAFDGHDLRVMALVRGRGDLAKRAEERLGSRVQFVANTESWTVRGYVAAFFRVLSSAVAFRPEKMVLSLKQANLIGRLAAMFVPGITCVAFEHIGEYQARRLQGVYGPLLRLSSWRVDEVWADCTQTLKETRRYFVPRRRVERVIPLFIASRNATWKTDYDASQTLLLAAAGRLVPRKNVTAIVEVVAGLRGDGVDAILDVYGDGPEMPSIEAAVARRGLQDGVTLRGYQSDWVARATDADVFLNLSGREGFCIVVAEAMLAGLPVVAVDVGGIRDYGRDGENMLKLSTPDPDEARLAVLRLARDDELRGRLGRQARADMLRNYDAPAWQRQVAQALSPSPTPRSSHREERLVR